MAESTKKSVSNEILQKALTNIHGELEKKYTKATSFVAGNLVAFNANGELVDSGGTGGPAGGDENKIDVITGGTVGNIPIIDAKGMLSDSTMSIGDLVTTSTLMTDEDIDALIADLETDGEGTE